MRRIDQNPAPNKYTLPPIIGNKQPNKMAAPAYVMTSRREVGALYLYQFCWFKVRFVSSWNGSKGARANCTTFMGKSYEQLFSLQTKNELHVWSEEW